MCMPIVPPCAACVYPTLVVVLRSEAVLEYRGTNQKSKPAAALSLARSIRERSSAGAWCICCVCVVPT
jgi:hypothetical protein